MNSNKCSRPTEPTALLVYLPEHNNWHLSPIEPSCACGTNVAKDAARAVEESARGNENQYQFKLLLNVKIQSC